MQSLLRILDLPSITVDDTNTLFDEEARPEVLDKRPCQSTTGNRICDGRGQSLRFRAVDVMHAEKRRVYVRYLESVVLSFVIFLKGQLLLALFICMLVDPLVHQFLGELKL